MYLGGYCNFLNSTAYGFDVTPTGIPTLTSFQDLAFDWATVPW